MYRLLIPAFCIAWLLIALWGQYGQAADKLTGSPAEEVVIEEASVPACKTVMAVTCGGITSAGELPAHFGMNTMSLAGLPSDIIPRCPHAEVLQPPPDRSHAL